MAIKREIENNNKPNTNILVHSYKCTVDILQCVHSVKTHVLHMSRTSYSIPKS